MSALLTGAALLAAALGGTALWLRGRYVAVTIDGRSMLPTHRPGERLLVRRTTARAVRTGQVVVLGGFGGPHPAGRRGRATSAPDEGPTWIIKRVAAVPGDPVPRATVPALAGAPGDQVPPGHLVLLGDNPPYSRDSRQAGYFTADRLLGVVVRRMEEARPAGNPG